jgi:hypothetical protein
MIKRTSLIILVLMLVCCVSGCSEFGGERIDIPTELNGDWTLAGTVTSSDNATVYDIFDRIEIRDGRVYPEGGGEYQATYVNKYLNIYIEDVIKDEMKVDCGQVTTTLKVTLLFSIESVETEYDGFPVGIFEIDSECEGVSQEELSGEIRLTRV